MVAKAAETKERMRQATVARQKVADAATEVANAVEQDLLSVKAGAAVTEEMKQRVLELSALDGWAMALKIVREELLAFSQGTLPGAHNKKREERLIKGLDDVKKAADMCRDVATLKLKAGAIEDEKDAMVERNALIENLVTEFNRAAGDDGTTILYEEPPKARRNSFLRPAKRVAPDDSLLGAGHGSDPVVSALQEKGLLNEDGEIVEE